MKSPMLTMCRFSRFRSCRILCGQAFVAGCKVADACGRLRLAVGAVLANALPFLPKGDSEALNIIHTPIALWLSAGLLAYGREVASSHAQRMNYVRFSGEWFIYFALTALGGVALMAFTVFGVSGDRFRPTG